MSACNIAFWNGRGRRAGHARRNDRRLGAELIEAFLMDHVRARSIPRLSGVRMLFFTKEICHRSKAGCYRFASRASSRKPRYHGECIFCSRNAGRLFATPLFLVLLVVEDYRQIRLAVTPSTSVSRDYRGSVHCRTQSNVLAILGLLGASISCCGVIDRLRFLDEGLAIVLVLIGGKMIGANGGCTFR